jgi:Family of unknown function (DUF6049)
MPRQRSTHPGRRAARAARPGPCAGVTGLVSGLVSGGAAAGARRLSRYAAALGLAALAVGAPALAAASPAAAAGSPQVSIAILSISPQTARPGRPVTITGTVSNPTARTVSGLVIQLWSSSTRFASRSEMASYAAGQLQADAPVPGVMAQPGRLGPGMTRQWTLSVRPARLGLAGFGVYPLAVQVDSGLSPLDAERTFLPFWPGSAKAAGLAQREKLAWVWPLIGQPQQDACPALLSNDLAGSLSPTGRLGRLLADGTTAVAGRADLTWAIDPSLLDAAVTMKRPYQVGGRAACAGAVRQRASPAARAWLAGAASVTARQDFFTTPYADVDVMALSHAGMSPDLAHAYTRGRALAQSLLGTAQRPSSGSGGIAWPTGGIADYPTLGSLAANGIGTVILNSSLMPPRVPVGYTPSAITSTPDGLNAGLHVALADSTLGQVLASAPTAAASRPAAGSFAAEQRFLAETAMIAAEQPGLARSVVVTPPRQWNPAPGLASALLAETTSAPWLRPASLADLVTAGPGAGQVARQPPPRRVTGHGELHASMLRKLRRVEQQIRLQASVLGQSPSGYLASAVATVESSAWRGDPGRPRALLARLTGYLNAQWRQLRIVGTGQDTLTGKSGSVPVSINNKLGQRVTVRLHVWAPSGRIMVTLSKPEITIGPHQQRTVAMRVHASAAGSTVLKLELLAPNGDPLPGTRAQLTVDATNFGSTAKVIIAVACVVFVITAAARAIRRRGRGGPAGPGPRAGDSGQPAAGAGPAGRDGPARPAGAGAGLGEEANGADPAGSPGGSAGRADSVGTERAREDDTPEEPDEYASAPGRLDRPG